MKGIEKYIKENIEEFDVVPVPEGSRNVFLQKVRVEKSRRRARTIVMAISSMAAAAAITVSFLPESLSYEIEKHHKELVLKEMEIIASVSETSPELIDEVMNTIRVVVSDAIPLEEQLPDEMGVKAKKEILKEMKKAKEKGIKLYLMVENADWEKIYSGEYRSMMKPESLIGSMLAWSIRYGVHFFFCKPSTTASMIRKILHYEAKEWLEHDEQPIAGDPPESQSG